MRKTEGINQTRKGKPLNWEERIQIETLQREGLSNAQIGKRIGRPARMKKRNLKYAICAKTIYNLIDRRMVSGVNNESL